MTKLQRRTVLFSAAETQANIKIQIIPGIALAPRSVGQSWHYETASGSRIWHPAAYSKRGWSNMRYVASTRRVIVGSDWLQA